MKTLVVENTWIYRDYVNCGWGNGYILIPKGHPLYGKPYDEIDVDVNGGLTFSELITEDSIDGWPGLSRDDIGLWAIGFDTAHSWDNLDTWPKEAVEAETERLRQQVEAIENED